MSKSTTQPQPTTVEGRDENFKVVSRKAPTKTKKPYFDPSQEREVDGNGIPYPLSTTRCRYGKCDWKVCVYSHVGQPPLVFTGIAQTCRHHGGYSGKKKCSCTYCTFAHPDAGDDPENCPKGQSSCPGYRSRLSDPKVGGKIMCKFAHPPPFHAPRRDEDEEDDYDEETNDDYTSESLGEIAFDENRPVSDWAESASHPYFDAAKKGSSVTPPAQKQAPIAPPAQKQAPIAPPAQKQAPIAPPAVDPLAPKQAPIAPPAVDPPAPVQMIEHPMQQSKPEPAQAPAPAKKEISQANPPNILDDILRSRSSSHIDPLEELTIRKILDINGLKEKLRLDKMEENFFDTAIQALCQLIVYNREKNTQSKQ